MEISNDINKFYAEICNIAYAQYCDELRNHKLIPQKSKNEFCKFFSLHSKHAQCIIVTENGIFKGYLLYSLQEDTSEIRCNIPVWGYGSSEIGSQKIMSHLFMYLAEQIVRSKSVYFSVHLYAGDIKIQRLFSYMQFGIIAEKGVRCISTIEDNSDICTRKISKDELSRRWSEIWLVLEQLINHLKGSPVFYHCNEFTESMYKCFFSSDDTIVYIAEDKNNIVGIIEANVDNYNLLFHNEKSMNVGEAYVMPKYRGSHLAQTLLSSIEKDLLSRRIEYDWVEHGTANPNARGFWSKYFETVEYEFVRTITC